MKAKDKTTGTFKEVYVKALDSLPVGTVVEYEGTSADIPVGWQSYSTGKIKKTSNTRAIAGKAVNVKSNSTIDAYSCDYSNKAFGGKLLWTNSSPSTSFAGQTIQVDLSGYDAVQIISTGTNNSYHRISSGIVPIGYVGQVSWYAQLSYYVRTFNVYSTGVTFHDATDTAINTGSYGTNNSTCIPVYIIGYKTGLFS